MACVHIIYEEYGEKKKAQFCYFDGASEVSIISYFTRERKGISIKELHIAKDTDEMIEKLKENGNE